MLPRSLEIFGRRLRPYLRFLWRWIGCRWWALVEVEGLSQMKGGVEVVVEPPVMVKERVI